MKKIVVNNSKGLIAFLDSCAHDYQVVQDGWKVEIPYNEDDIEHIFQLGVNYANFLNS